MPLSKKIIKYRYESFGGILHLQTPSALVYVDKDYMRSLGFGPSPLWDLQADLLSAPTEVHLAITDHCSFGCRHCYMDSQDRTQDIRQQVVPGELGLAGLKKAIDVLAEMRVFHVALGGGESFEMPWLMELVHYARAKGLVPNITSNGHFISEKNVFNCLNFGQMNISLNDVGPDFAEQAVKSHFEMADHSLKLLRQAGIKAGINCVVNRHNFANLEQIVKYAKQRKLREIEFLRFKPAGRAGAIYSEMALTATQAVEFYPRIVALMKKYRVRLKLDCSFVPMICAHNPDPERLDFFSVTGCDGGNVLMGGRADGRVAPCSFAPWEEKTIFDMPDKWRNARTFAPFRFWTMSAPEPCSGCRYLKVCRGGCHAVTFHKYGRLDLPDPECPIVQGRIPLIN